MMGRIVPGKRCLVTALMAWGALTCGYCAAADWKPDKRVVEVVVPNVPGGGNDRIVRLVIKIAQERRLVDAIMNVVNKPGAGTVMGLTYLNQHQGDGNYIGIISATFTGDYVTGRSTFGPGDITPIAQLFSESVAFAVKRPGRMFRIVITGRQRPHGGKARNRHRRNSALSTAAYHCIGIAAFY